MYTGSENKTHESTQNQYDIMNYNSSDSICTSFELTWSSGDATTTSTIESGLRLWKKNWHIWYWVVTTHIPAYWGFLKTGVLCRLQLKEKTESLKCALL